MEPVIAEPVILSEVKDLLNKEMLLPPCRITGTPYLP